MELIIEALSLMALIAYFSISTASYRKLQTKYEKLRTENEKLFAETRKMQADLCLQLSELEDEFGRRLCALEESDAVASLQAEVRALKNQVESAILPDDSAARKAKEQIDAFNAGVFNILSYHGQPTKRHTEESDDDEE